MTESKGSFDTNLVASETAFQSILRLPGNDCCFECGTRAPDWASLGFGILICLECAGRHRSLGISFCHRCFEFDNPIPTPFLSSLLTNAIHSYPPTPTLITFLHCCCCRVGGL